MPPCYKDGTLTKVGDFVKGKPNNTPHEIVGQIIKITKGTVPCYCTVAFTVYDCGEVQAFTKIG